MNMTNMIERISNFGQTLAGDPEQNLRDFIRKNNVPQEALDYAQQQANIIYKAMQGMKRH